MALTTAAAIRTATRRKRHLMLPALITNSGSMSGVSAWRAARGWLPQGAIPPAAGEIPTKATVGAIPFSNPGAGNTLYIGALQFSPLDVSNLAGTLVLYDRLWHCGALAGNITTTQTVTSVAINRGDTTGDNVQIWIEIYAGGSTTASTFSVSYTNQSGTAGRTATASYTTTHNVTNGMIRCLLEGTDTGVQSVESLTLSVSTGAAGSFGITLARPLAWISNDEQNFHYPMDPLSYLLASVPSNACLAMMLVGARTANSGSTVPQTGHLDLIEG
jgi:hypothetical protein